MPKIYKTKAAIEGRPKKDFLIDTIENEGMLWLVPQWIDDIDQGWTAPARLILLDYLPHTKTNHEEFDFALNSPLPKSVYGGQVPPELEKQYVVRQLPNLRFPLATNNPGN